MFLCLSKKLTSEAILEQSPSLKIKKYVAEHKSGGCGHLYFEQGKLTDSLTTFGPIGPRPPPPDNKTNLTVLIANY